MCQDNENPVEIPIDGTLDLHLFHPSDVKDLVNEYLNECLKRDILYVRIIHGKGTGALRKTVHSVLSRNTLVKKFYLDETGNWGATVVHLGSE